MRQHLATFVDDFQRHKDQIAIVTYPGNRRISTSYAQVAAFSGRFSRLFAEQNINPGDRVLLWGANSAEWVAAFFGCVLRGIIVVPLDAAGSATFAESVIADTSPRLIIGDSNLLQRINSTPKFLLGNSFLPRDPLLTPDPSLNSETPLQILYTSGTTSAPKGIVHTHGNVLSSVEILEREMQKYLRYERWVHPLRFLHTLPLSHVFGQFMGMWVPPLLAAQVHYDDNLIAGHLIERIRRERISVAAVVPRLLELLRAYLLAEDPALQPRLSQIRNERRLWRRWWHLRGVHRRFGFKFWAFVSGGATLPAELEQFWNMLGFVLVQGYGMTETTALATLNHPFHIAHGSVGKPLPGREVRIAEDGEILIRGTMLAAGAWRNGQLEPRQDEWLHTGDLGSIDANGQVHFLGRKSDVIVAASGMNIHPADLEAAVDRQPGVRDSMVVGREGPRGQEPVAVVILKENSETTLPQILAQANRELQEFQQIASALQWPSNEFPRNHMGKLLRREVAAWAKQQLETKSPQPAQPLHQDSLLQLLQQVTGEPTSGMQDSAALTIDSLGRMQLAMAIEEKFGIAVNDESIANPKTIADLRKLLVPAASGLADETWIQCAAPLEMSTQEPEVPQPQSVNPRYSHWPWSRPVQIARVTFLELVLRPLVAMLANPNIQRSDPLPQQPSIYIANHVTAADVALVLYALPGRVRRHMAIAMSAELLAAWRQSHAAAGVGGGPLRWLAPLQAQAVIALFNVFPLPSGAGLRRSFAHAGEALDRGYNLLIFPEGRRTTSGQLQPFQTGISLLAEESQTEVVPMALINLWQAATNRIFHPKGLTIAAAAPLRIEPGESHQHFTARLQAAVKHLIEQNGAHHPPVAPAKVGLDPAKG